MRRPVQPQGYSSSEEEDKASDDKAKEAKKKENEKKKKKKPKETKQVSFHDSYSGIFSLQLDQQTVYI